LSSTRIGADELVVELVADGNGSENRFDGPPALVPVPVLRLSKYHRVVRELRGRTSLHELSRKARVVTDIEEIVRYARFAGLAEHTCSEREVKMVLRNTLFKYKLHRDQELVYRAYGCIRDYY
jgi:hypothetical protein